MCWGGLGVGGRGAGETGQTGVGQGKVGAGWPGSVPRPNKTCLLSQESLWVSFRLEAGPGCSLLGAGTGSLPDVPANQSRRGLLGPSGVCGDAGARTKGLRWKALGSDLSALLGSSRAPCGARVTDTPGETVPVNWGVRI